MHTLLNNAQCVYLDTHGGEMDITVSKDTACTVMALSGRMDATTTADFDEKAQKILQEGENRILVDMTDLVYISSAGLRSLLGLAKKAMAKKGGLAFCSLQPMVTEVFRISGFDRMLKVFADRNAGIAALQTGGGNA